MYAIIIKPIPTPEQETFIHNLTQKHHSKCKISGGGLIKIEKNETFAYNTWIQEMRKYGFGVELLIVN